jgi:hypothetical protein
MEGRGVRRENRIQILREPEAIFSKETRDSARRADLCAQLGSQTHLIRIQATGLDIACMLYESSEGAPSMVIHEQANRGNRGAYASPSDIADKLAAEMAENLDADLITFAMRLMGKITSNLGQWGIKRFIVQRVEIADGFSTESFF